MDLTSFEGSNALRYRRGDTAGHYESYFVRANHPSRPLGFWIRYTIFSPRGRPAEAVGELWAIAFDGERGGHVAAKSVFPLARCDFGARGLDVRIGEARLGEARLTGEASSRGRTVAWDLQMSRGGAEPLVFLPPSLYEARLPRAKSLVPAPLARFSGRLVTGPIDWDVDGWVGSQNHNWGERHTDSYAWGQVAGFDDAPDVFLECATARIRLGPVWTPPFTLVAVREGHRRLDLTSLPRALRARGAFEPGRWELESRTRDVTVRATFTAPLGDFVGLTYDNPPGGSKTCLNCKIARCELILERRGEAPRRLRAMNRAAFEILTDAHDHGVAVVV